jgi:hypothetical protein
MLRTPFPVSLRVVLVLFLPCYTKRRRSATAPFFRSSRPPSTRSSLYPRRADSRRAGCRGGPGGRSPSPRFTLRAPTLTERNNIPGKYHAAKHSPSEHPLRSHTHPPASSGTERILLHFRIAIHSTLTVSSNIGSHFAVGQPHRSHPSTNQQSNKAANINTRGVLPMPPSNKDAVG